MLSTSVNCWICGEPATTGEHKIKRNLLVNLHGKGPYEGPKEMLHIRDSGQTRLRGPNAKQIKFQNVLCAQCNNSTSQPFDKAYDCFCEYVLTNEELITKRRVIDFADVFGEQFQDEQVKLYKYFAKLFGCDLAASGMPVPYDVKSLIGLPNFLTKLRITFAVNEDKLLLPPRDRPTGFGGLLTSQENLRTRADPNPFYWWDLFFSFLHVFFWYDWLPNEPFGACWTANARFIYLGYFAPLDPDTRDKMREMAAGRWAAEKGQPSKS
jgi:hypothetical protein